MSKAPAVPGGGRVVAEQELTGLVAADREAGRTVAFANGCFDLLHVGHVRYLADAAAQADRLIVAINDDASVKSLKGAGRPIMSAADRAEMIAALESVDYVVVFSDPDVNRLLALLRPDVHCKGTDYTPGSVPERDTVLAYGGRIAIVGDPKDHSTRDLIGRIKELLNAILIVRLGSLGDIIHAIPAAAAIRRAYPGSRIDWLVDVRHADLLKLVRPVDTCIPVATNRPASISATVRALRRGRYDAAIDLQGLLKSAVLARLSGAARVIGFPAPLLRERAARLFYTETAGDATPHVIEKNLSILRAIGVRVPDIEFPLDDCGPEIATTARSRLGIGASDPFAIINPGAAWPNKRWPPVYFAEVARALVKRYNLRSIVLWGPGEEALAETVVTASDGAAALSPPTTIADLVSLARAAAIMISGDTGPMHVAGAVGTPLVGIFGPTDPARNGPWSEDDLTVSRFSSCACHYQRRCRLAAWCLLDISPREVMALVDKRLAGFDAHV